MKAKQRSNRQRRVLCARTLIALVVLTIFCCSQKTLAQQWNTNGNDISNANSGNVGVGTTTPVSALHVATESTVVPRGITNAQHSSDGNSPLLIFRKSRGTKLSPAAVIDLDGLGNLQTHAYDGSSYITTSRLKFGVDGTVSAGSVPTSIQFFTGSNNSGIERMRISSSGNVGIGTTTPTQKLEVNGGAIIPTQYGSSAAGGTLTLQSTSHATKGAINIGVDQTTTTNIGQSGTPGNKLVVASDRLIVNNAGARVNGAADHGDLSVTKINITNADALQFRTTSPTITSNGSINFTANNINGDNVRFNVQNSSVSNAFVIDTNTATPARLLDVRDLGNSRFTVTGGGNVGIGTTAPIAKLHVAGDGKVTGNLTVDGNIAAKYQDVAEWVPAVQALPPGTVVTLNRSQSNLVEASSKAYDTRVAGVVSEKPGLALGERGENKLLIATTGRVKIKVDATNAPIEIGDLLVTSEKEGIAMKSVPVTFGGVEMHRPGTLIGKALEPLAKGQGEILVLLSLQ